MELKVYFGRTAAPDGEPLRTDSRFGRTAAPHGRRRSAGAPNLANRLELVAKPADGHDVPRIRRLGLNLRAEPLHVNVQRLGVANVVSTPDPIDELHPGEHAAGVAQQNLE